MPEKEDWTAWNEELARYLTRETEGFEKDLYALKQHIKNLTNLCPKDRAGWPRLKGLAYIDILTINYNRIRELFKQGILEKKAL